MFYYNCFEVGMCYIMLASLVFGVITVSINLIWRDERGIGQTIVFSLLPAFFLAVVGGPLLGSLFGVIMVGLRACWQREPMPKEETAIRTSLVKCVHCGTVADRKLTGGWCEDCGKKLPIR
jgi:hypothetical protein